MSDKPQRLAIEYRHDEVSQCIEDISPNLSELGLTVYCPPYNVEHTHVNFLELLTNPASIVKHHDITKMGHGKLLYSKCTSVCKP